MPARTSTIRLSVALVTRNRPESLERCLSSCRSQSAQPYEIVVSDDSDETDAAATRRVAELYNTRYIKGPKRGLYANRNCAALACNGTHIRTMDDDHTFPLGHFELCQQSVLSDPEAIWTTGEIFFVNEKVLSQTDVANQLHPSGAGIAPNDLNHNWTIADGSTIYPASVFQKNFRMIEEYNYGSSYLEFGAFLNHHGYNSRCLIGAPVEHHATIETISRMTTYNRDQSACLLFSSLSYNLFFKPSLSKAASYAFKAFWHSRFDPLLIMQLPGIISKVRRRWAGCK